MLVMVFVVIFFSTSNINVSFDALTKTEQYPAEAFVKTRAGRITAKVGGLHPTTGMISGAGLTAKIAFDAAGKKVNVSLRDRKNRPVSRITVIGTISRVGQRHITKQFKMRETNSGDFTSPPLDLSDGGWVLMVSAYNLRTLDHDKLLFHTERAIFLGKKKK